MQKGLGNMNIKSKLNLGYALVIVMMIISGILSMISLSVLNSTMDDYANRISRVDTAVKMCRINVTIAARNIREMALNDDVSTYDAYETTIRGRVASVEEELAVMKELAVVDESLRQEYADTIVKWETEAYEIVDMIQAGERDAAVDKMFNECMPVLDELVGLAEQLDSITDSEKQDAIRLGDTVFWMSVIAVVVFVVLAAVMAFLVGSRIVKSITVPLIEIEEAAQQLAQGNLKANITVRSSDEIGILANSLKTSFETMSSYISDIDRIMEEFADGNFDVRPRVEWKGDFESILEYVNMFEESIAKTVTGIRNVVDQVSNGAAQIAGTSNELATGATEQAGVTQELAATIDTAAEEIINSADTAAAVSTKVATTAVEINKSNEKMQEMVKSMNEIGEASQKIRQIIDTINSIATQTNLLALNASIEAARAGDAGRGFAVVADQVSLLAAQSSDAAKESNDLIATSLAAIEKGIVIADETARQLESVVAESQEITVDIGHVAEVLKIQADSFDQIKVGVDHINDVVQTNSATSEECAASSQEMNSQAEQLEDLVRRFKVGKYK